MRRYTASSAVLVAALLAVWAAGCASVDYQRLGHCADGDTACEKRDQDAKGIRYLGLSPYLIVHTNPNGTLNVRLEYLPDPHKKTSVLPKATGAKIETTFEFERGALKKADTLADATAVPKALLEAAKSILPAILEAPERMAGAKQPPHHLFPAPQVFKVLVRGDEVMLKGDGQNEPFAITLLPEDKKNENAAANGASDTNGNGGGGS